MRGRLIVIDGIDGSGKATQAALLAKRLRSEGMKARTIDFPGYARNPVGELIGECLSGGHGDFVGSSPRIASVLFAADRFASRERLRRWLAAGCIVVADRYVSSNQIHQGGKISDSKERREFLDWLERLEFGVFGLPRPDLVVYLDVPGAVSRRLLAGRNRDSKKTYLKGREDQHESDPEYLDRVRENTLRFIRQFNRWKRVICARDGHILPQEVIAGRIWHIVEDALQLNAVGSRKRL